MADILNHDADSGGNGLARNVAARSKIYAAVLRLQDATSQADALEAVEEITANLLGSEEAAIFKVDNQRAVCWLYWYFGIDPNKNAYLDVMREPALQAALTGKILISGDSGREKLLSMDHPVTALVPILASGAIAAVLVIFRLLPQKARFDAIDREICEVLSHCAERALQPNSK